MPCKTADHKLYVYFKQALREILSFGIGKLYLSY